MLLRIQLEVILYAFIMGIAYGVSFSLKQYICLYISNTKTKSGIDFIYHILFVCIGYYGLYKINGGISNMYLLVIFLLAIYLYYLVYYPTLLPCFMWLKKISKPIYYGIYLLGGKLYSIMNKVPRRKHNGKHQKKKKKKF